MENIEIRGELGRLLSFAVGSYENEAAEHPCDANWLSCDVQLELGSFRGAVHVPLMTTDFERFFRELDEMLCGQATCARFRTIEEVLHLDIELNKTGRATVAGTLREEVGSRTAISFEFGTDQSFLAATRRQLKNVVTTFPERSGG